MDAVHSDELGRFVHGAERASERMSSFFIIGRSGAGWGRGGGDKELFLGKCTRYVNVSLELF